MALGRRSKQPRHGAGFPADRQDRHAEGDLDSYLAALSGGDSPASPLTGRFGDAQVFQIRLPPDRLAVLRTVAEQRGMTPAALLTEWAVERIDHERRRPPTGRASRTSP